MPKQVVVLGAGYAGAGAITELESQLDDAELTWISDTDYHLVLHEVHRVIRDPTVRDDIVIPVEEIKSPSTEFIEARVANLDTDERIVELDGHDNVPYDYALVALGSQTAFFGIDGLADYAYTLKGLEDALDIHDAITEAVDDATATDPARIVIGGAGLSGIQTAGEVATYRDEHHTPIDIHLVEGMDNVMPSGDPELQGAIRSRLEQRNVDILTGEFIGEVDDTTVYVGDDTEVDYDVLIWTGGITGRDCLTDAQLETDERSNRILANQTFQTDDERVFAIGDTAIIDQSDEQPAPPTAQAAWQATSVASENLARQMNGQSLRTWSYENKGTVISIGDDAVGHDIPLLPMSTFGSYPARFLKKFIAARWIADTTSWGRAVSAWKAL
jgi:NADH dehydrogenase